MLASASRLALGVTLAAGFAAVGIAQGTPAATDWPVSNYAQTANRYSPLTQITAANVATLEKAWSIHLKPEGYTGRLREDEAIPIVIGNTMYLGSPYGVVMALDATTGAEKWKFTLPNNDVPSTRGIAYWPGGEGFAPSIIFGARSGLMYSIKASDGTLNPNFGGAGFITLKTPEVMQTGMTPAY